MSLCPAPGTAWKVIRSPPSSASSRPIAVGMISSCAPWMTVAEKLPRSLWIFRRRVQHREPERRDPVARVETPNQEKRPVGVLVPAHA